MTDLQTIDYMIASLKALKSGMKKTETLSQKVLNLKGATVRQNQKANNDLNWHCMHVDKLKTDIARAFKGSCLDVDTGEKEYNPSGFHCYKY